MDHTPNWHCLPWSVKKHGVSSKHSGSPTNPWKCHVHIHLHLLLLHYYYLLYFRRVVGSEWLKKWYTSIKKVGLLEQIFTWDVVRRKRLILLTFLSHLERHENAHTGRGSKIHDAPILNTHTTNAEIDVKKFTHVRHIPERPCVYHHFEMKMNFGLGEALQVFSS